MQTVYYTTANFIRHTGNVVDFTEYRRRLAHTAVPAGEPFLPEAAEGCPARTRRPYGTHPGLFLDLCASAAIVGMTVVAVIQFLAA